MNLEQLEQQHRKIEKCSHDVICIEKTKQISDNQILLAECVECSKLFWVYATRLNEKVKD